MSERSATVSRSRTRGLSRADFRDRARPRVRITARAAVLLVTMMLLAIALVYPARLFWQQRSQIGDLEKQTQALIVENQVLTGKVQKLNDPAYLERLARECLGMVKTGETAFVVVPKGGDPQPISC